VKLHDFGLWYWSWRTTNWSTTIPQTMEFCICYDGEVLGYQRDSLHFGIYQDKPYIINLKSNFKKDGIFYQPNRLITLDDFEIIANPDYKGTV
jgi:hypothetical protein